MEGRGRVLKVVFLEGGRGSVTAVDVSRLGDDFSVGVPRSWVR